MTAATTNENTGITEITTYPNPTSGKLNVAFYSAAKEKYSFKVMNLLGEVLLTDVSTFETGNNVKEFDLTSFTRGIYLLIVEKEGEVKTMRIVVE